MVAIFNYTKEAPFPIPNESYLFLFIDTHKKDFIYYCRINNNFYSGTVKEVKELSIFFISKYVNDEKKNLRFLVYKCN